METTKFRDVPIAASRVGLGTWAMGGLQWGGADDDASVRTIHQAFDLGINFIDTAPAYGFGHAEEIVGRAIAERGNRDQVVIATKVGLEQSGNALLRNASRRRIFEEIDGSLLRLRTDYVDLYQVHWPDLATPIEETAAALRDLQATGKVRAIGVSNYAVAAMQRFQRVVPLAAAQPPLNLFERDAEREVLPWCRKYGIGAITYGALCRALLTGALGERTQFRGDDLRKTDPKFQPPRYAQYLQAVKLIERYAGERYGKSLVAFAIRWVLDHPGVSTALWGARHPSELAPVDEVMAFHLDDEARAYVDQILVECVRDPIGPEFMAPPERGARGMEAPP